MRAAQRDPGDGSIPIEGVIDGEYQLIAGFGVRINAHDRFTEPILCPDADSAPPVDAVRRFGSQYGGCAGLVQRELEAETRSGCSRIDIGDDIGRKAETIAVAGDIAFQAIRVRIPRDRMVLWAWLVGPQLPVGPGMKRQVAWDGGG